MNLVQRVKGILMQPKNEWQTIAEEPTTVAELYKGYIVILAAVGPVASILGMSLFYRVPFGTSVVHGIITYVLTLAGVYVVALIINALAPNFQGEKDSTQALKVAAYSSTAAWVGGVFSIVPAISILGAIVSLYSLYLLYLGLPVLMKAPQEKAIVYTIVVVIAAVILFVLIGVVTGGFIAYPGRTL